jgi:hypothetical protein
MRRNAIEGPTILCRYFISLHYNVRRSSINHANRGTAEGLVRRLRGRRKYASCTALYKTLLASACSRGSQLSNEPTEELDLDFSPVSRKVIALSRRLLIAQCVQLKDTDYNVRGGMII